MNKKTNRLDYKGKVYICEADFFGMKQGDKIDVQIIDIEKIISQRAEQIARLKDALENLMGEQNGPPLIRDAHHWKNAMDKAEQALAATPLEERQGE